MKKLMLLAWSPVLTLGCKKTLVSPITTPMPVTAATVAASQLSPIVNGVPYQLSLDGGLFGFCDSTGPQQVNLANGKQTLGTQRCDRLHEIVQNHCGEQVEIDGHPEGGNDHLAINDNEFVLNGQSGACDREGKIVIVSTYIAVEVIDGAANKVAIVGSGDKVAIGSGWVAWSTLDKDHPLRLETVAKAMEHATTPKND